MRFMQQIRKKLIFYIILQNRQHRQQTKTPHMAQIFVLLADGFEEIEALAPVDILRRGGQDVFTASINGTLWVTSSHGITVKADILFEEAPLEQADMLLLPGGMPGSKNLDEHKGVRQALLAQDRREGHIGAICAAPMVLGHLGLLKGRRATCSPGFESHLTGEEGPAGTVPWRSQRSPKKDHLC